MPAGSSPSLPALPGDIHFATSFALDDPADSMAHTDCTLSSENRFPGLGPLWNFFALGIVLWLLVAGLQAVIARSSSRPAPSTPVYAPSAGAAWYVVIVTLVGLIVYGFVSNARRNRRYAQVAYPARSDPRFRLRIIGRPGALDQAVRMIAAEQPFFEPRIFRVPGVRGRGCRLAMLNAALVACALVGAMIVNALLLRLIGDALGLPVLVVAGALLYWALSAALWPAYIRVTPGRMEVLRYGILGLRKPRAACIDLRSATIVARLPHGLLVIPPGNESGVWYRLVLTGGTLTRRLVSSVITAARSLEQAPSLPSDELVG